MPTKEKIGSVEGLKSRLGGIRALVLTEYRGLTVQQLGELRRHLRGASAEYKVVKNRLARLAVQSSELEALSGHLKGPTGMVIVREDPVAVAKALHTFARTNQALTIKAGYVDGQMLAPDGLKALADLPPRDTLRSQLVGALQGSMAQLVGLLTAPQRELAYLLAQRSKTGDDAGTGSG